MTIGMAGPVFSRNATIRREAFGKGGENSLQIFGMNDIEVRLAQTFFRSIAQAFFMGRAHIEIVALHIADADHVRHVGGNEAEQFFTFLQLLFRPAPLRDIPEVNHHTGDDGIVKEIQSRAFEDHHRPVFMKDTKAVGNGRFYRKQVLAEILRCPGDILGDDPVKGVLTDQFVGTIAYDPLHGRAGVADRSQGIDDEDDIRGIFGNGPKKLFASPEGCFHLFPVGNVMTDDIGGNYSSLRIVDISVMEMDEPFPAVLGDDFVFHHRRHCHSPQHFFQAGKKQLLALLREDVIRAERGNFFLGVAHIPAKHFVYLDKFTGSEIDAINPRLGVVEELAVSRLALLPGLLCALEFYFRLCQFL